MHRTKGFFFFYPSIKADQLRKIKFKDIIKDFTVKKMFKHKKYKNYVKEKN